MNDIIKKPTPFISLCIPTNGVPEWVFPVLDSIYSQGVANDLFEVIICDNGRNEIFKKKIKAYKAKKSNLFFYETTMPLFLSEPETYKHATGLFIKFINHRTRLLPNSLNYLIDFVKNNIIEKPFIYFSDGFLGYWRKKKVKIFNNFNSFVDNLSYLGTWSTGMGFWKCDFDKISKSVIYNKMFPHTSILFGFPQKEKYIIDDTILLDEINPGKKPKGNYDFYWTFSVEYLCILLNLVQQHYINYATFQDQKKAMKKYLSDFYFDTSIRKEYTSYDISNFKDSVSAFYSVSSIKFNAWIRIPHRLVRKIYKIVFNPSRTKL